MHDPVWFVILSGLVFFAWGEIYSLFPSTCTDTFGTKFATTNAGLLYTAKGTAALLVPYSNSIQKMTGTWDMVFIIAAAANILAAVLAIAVLKSWRARVIARNQAAILARRRGPSPARGSTAGAPGIPWRNAAVHDSRLVGLVFCIIAISSAPKLQGMCLQ